MKLKINLLKPFSDVVGKSELKLDLDGTTLEDLLKVLIDRYPKLKEEFYTKTNELLDYILIFVNNKPISNLNGIKTELKNGDELYFFIAISGG